MRDRLITLLKDQDPNVKIDDNSDDKTLEEVGFDSLDIATIMMNIEAEFNIKISSEQIDSLTINDLLRLIEA